MIARYPRCKAPHAGPDTAGGCYSLSTLHGMWACARLHPALGFKVCQLLDSLHLQTWIFTFSLLFPYSSSLLTLSHSHTHAHTCSHIAVSIISLTFQSCSFFLAWLSLSLLQPAWIPVLPQDRSHVHLPGNLPWTPPHPPCPKQRYLPCAADTSCIPHPPLELSSSKCFIILWFWCLK